MTYRFFPCKKQVLFLCLTQSKHHATHFRRLHATDSCEDKKSLFPPAETRPKAKRENLQSLFWGTWTEQLSVGAEGLLSIVGPVTKESDLAGIGIFNANEATVHEHMKNDPAIHEGIFTYEILPTMSFPDNCLSCLQDLFDSLTE